MIVPIILNEFVSRIPNRFDKVGPISVVSTPVYIDTTKRPVVVRKRKRRIKRATAGAYKKRKKPTNREGVIQVGAGALKHKRTKNNTTDKNRSHIEN